MNEAEARVWVRDGVVWLQRGAALTPTTLDDRIVTLTLNAIDTDFLWVLMWRVISKVLEDEPVVVEADEAVLAEAQIAAVDWMQVMQIIMAIMEIIKNWKK